ncbi:MAG TPA: M48 family metallopeptidase [Candidatus Omnitrophota bacterium]|nr:M48 family metallopeptidase [Candidatus Omnitrophota bacterium]
MKIYFRKIFLEKTFFILFSLSIFLTGCGTIVYNPATQRKEFIMVSTQEEISMGNNLHTGLLKEFKLSQNKEQIERLSRVGEKVALVSDRQDYKYKYFVLEKDELNAFTTPGGNIYVYTGLMNKLKSDDALAGVIAHEIGHCAARHVIKKYQASMGYDTLASLIFNNVQMTSATKQVLSLSSNVVMSLVFSSYSRQDEYEADRLAVKYLYLSGYDPQGMVATLQLLKKESQGSEGILILRSHPYLDDRIKGVKEEINKVQAQYSS